MTLSDAAIDEFSRHVLVPEIGPAGQTRLLATRVQVSGDPATAALVRDLLDRSGFGRHASAPDAAVVLGSRPHGTEPAPCVVGGGDGDTLHATVLASRPCPACAPSLEAGVPASDVARLALASLVATALVLQVAGSRPDSATLHLDLASGRLERRRLDGDGCARCRQSEAGVR